MPERLVDFGENVDRVFAARRVLARSGIIVRVPLSSTMQYSILAVHLHHPAIPIDWLIPCPPSSSACPLPVQ